MNLQTHSLASIPLAAAGYAVSGSAELTAAAVLTSIFIDLDHIPEYLIWMRLKSSISGFFKTSHRHASPTVCYPLHGWDCLVLGGVLLAWLWGLDWAMAVCTGWAYHLMIDQTGNPVGGLFYFLYYRLKKGFRRDRLAGAHGILCSPRPLRKGGYVIER
jgi:hypothetical protein